MFLYVSCLTSQRQTWTEFTWVLFICIVWAKILSLLQCPHCKCNSFTTHKVASVEAERKSLISHTVLFCFCSIYFGHYKTHNLDKNTMSVTKGWMWMHIKYVKLDCHLLLSVWIDSKYSLCFPLRCLDAIKCHDLKNDSLDC